MFVATAFALLALLPAALAQITVATPPSVVTCEPVSLSWTGGTGPYFVSAIPGGQPGATALESFPEQTGNSFTWTVNLPAGTSITIQVRDSTGTIQYSSPITIQAGPDSSCVGQSLSAGSSSTAGGTSASSTSGSSVAGAGTTTSAALSGSSPTSSPSAAATSHSSVSSQSQQSQSSTTSKAATSPSASSGASASFQVGAFSVAGLAGLIGALLF
ncbi:hypothetical protein CALVIDRAFT_541729 [Calocera viscosa TUFC12733]|uniref:Uncharacterized protein n=1 Tax=Calocera viscosa (strain TUFC12733) TaxID=1330018 RepID=A0A167HF15_CALVF|nr:hypothetical protein CALVIDRAFT_541729 [Calocera viscosa TUFC12733]